MNGGILQQSRKMQHDIQVEKQHMGKIMELGNDCGICYIPGQKKRVP